MSLFQCEECGCCENTALSAQGFKCDFMQDLFDWSGIESRKGKLLCSGCGPGKYRDGSSSEFGRWHGQFERIYLPKGKFFTNGAGNLEHNESGSEDFRQYALNEPEES